MAVSVVVMNELGGRWGKWAGKSTIPLAAWQAYPYERQKSFSRESIAQAPPPPNKNIIRIISSLLALCSLSLEVTFL